MTDKELVLQATDIWRSHGMPAGKNEYLEQRLKRQINAAILKAVTASTEFTFATGLVTHTFSDTNALVELRGKASDARDVYTILWGANNRLLYKYDEYEKDVSFSNTAITGTPKGWVRREQAGTGFPQVLIIGSVASGDTMQYKYLKNQINIADWPEAWGFVLVDQVLKRLNRPMFTTTAKESLNRMIDFYEAPKRGGHVALIDGVSGSSNFKTNTVRNVG